MTTTPDADGVLLAFYGDDFTGSTDVLESLARNGVETVLFLDTPEPEEVADLDGVQAVGMAGRSRTMSPDEMDDHLPAVFESLGAFDPALVLYKVCSTFDSAPDVGSIGHAIDLAWEEYDPAFVPVVVAAPSLAPRGRYVVFGNLFATVDGTTYRIDRHPTMRDHPVTPMTEADLTRHLAEQTDRPIESLPITALDPDAPTALEGALAARAEDADIVVMDGLDHDHQRAVGRLVWEAATADSAPLFSASSSGLTYALSTHWQTTGIASSPDSVTSAGAVDQVLVVSGSASPVNARQIDWALEHGFVGVELDTTRVIDPTSRETALEEAIDAARAVLERGDSPILHSARGPDDHRIEETRDRAAALDIDAATMTERIGAAQGEITRRLLDGTDVERVCVAGGDTSGHVAPRLDIYALEFLAPVGPGSPLCRARARTDRFDGLAIALKGGQVQTTADDDDYFEVVRTGGKP